MLVILCVQLTIKFDHERWTEFVVVHMKNRFGTFNMEKLFSYAVDRIRFLQCFLFVLLPSPHSSAQHDRPRMKRLSSNVYPELEWNRKKTEKKNWKPFSLTYFYWFGKSSKSRFKCVYLFILHTIWLTLAIANKSRVPIPDWSSRLRALERFLIEKFLKVSSGREPKRHMQQCEIENEKDFSSRSPSSAYISSFVESAASGGERWRMKSWRKKASFGTFQHSRCKSMFVEHKLLLQTIQIREKNDDLCDAVHLFHTSAPHVQAGRGHTLA